MVARSPYRSVELRRWREIRLAARTWALFRGSAENRASWKAPAGLEENSAVAINCHTGRAKRIAASSMYQSCGSRCQRWLFANERELQALRLRCASKLLKDAA